jgi:Leucine-rich repeat (LRR) protein
VLVSNRSINLSGKQVDLMQLVAELTANPALAWDITGQLVMDRSLIDSVPDDLLRLLPNLTEISLKNNNLREVPPSLPGSCPNLTRLLMSGNAIVNMDGLASISPRMIWAPNLTHLDLSSNRLTSFRGALLNAFTNLQVLTLAFNRITSLDDWQILPSALTQLDLSENSLESIDDLVLLLGSNCPKLEVLCLHHNYIARIPSIAGLLLDRCPALKFVDLKGNPQHGIRPEMLAKPTCEQLLYLKNRLTEEQTKAAIDQMDHLQHGGGTLDRSKILVTPSKRLSLAQQDATILGIATIAITDGQEGPAPASEVVPEASGGEASLVECRSKIAEYETELDNASLSEAKRYALKRSLAMERSMLIREERRLGLRN